MATLSASEVGVGAANATGAIYVAPKGTTLPTDATTALGAAFKLLGYTSDAGVTISESSTNTTIRAWENRAVVYNVRTEYTESVSFTPIQCNDDVAKLMWGSSRVTAATGTLVAKHSGDTLEEVVIAIETVPRTGTVRRYTGTFQLTTRGEQTLNGTVSEGRQLTFEAIADSNGVTLTEYTASTQTT